MTLQGGQVGPRGGRWTFDWLAERLEIGTPLARAEPPPAASPSASPTIAWTEPFNSESHGYAIRYPLGWKSSQADGTTTSDTFEATARPFSQLSIIRRTKDDLSLTEVADATFAPRSQAGWCRGGPFGRTGIPASPETFHDSVIDGHPALVRSECSFVDAVIDAGGDVLVIVFRSANRMPTGDASQFRHFMDTLEIGTPAPAPTQPKEPPATATPTPALAWTESFVSDSYGFSIRYPPGWTARQRDRPDGPDAFQGTTVDSAPSVSRLSITRREKEGGRTLQQTAYATLPHRSDPDGCHWNGPGIAFIPIAPHGFREAVIDGRPALVRSECSHVDAIVDLGQDILVVGLRSAGRTGGGDRWTFDRFMETLEISPSAEIPDGLPPRTHGP